jgi:hypothetical protein
MKDQTSTQMTKTTKNKSTNVVGGVCKLAVFFLLLFAGSAKAQCDPQTVVPYPATELGQQLLIDESNAHYAPMMEAANETREVAQAYVDANPCGGPTLFRSCRGRVCCETFPNNSTGGNIHWTTTCTLDDKPLCTIWQ